MIPSTDILGRKAEIQDCIASSEMEQALKRLIDFIRDFSPKMEDEAILLSMEYYDLEKELRMDIISYDNGKLTRRKLAVRMLGTLKAAMQKVDLS